MKKKYFPLLLCLSILATVVHSQQSKNLTNSQSSGNPLFQGWYADPEGAVFGNKYWIYPTYSALYEQQVFMDAFS